MFRKMICLASLVLVLTLVVTRAADADPNLVGYWTFDEGSGTTAFDCSGNNYHGTITGAEWVTGQFDGALWFNGPDYVIIPPEAWSTIEKQVTLAFWAYGDPDMSRQECCCFSAMQNPTSYSSRVASINVPWTNGYVYWDTGGTGPDSSLDRVAQKAVAPEVYKGGAWQHWAFTKDADAGVQKIYLNGVLWNSTDGLVLPMIGVTAIKIGASAGGTWSYEGMIDDFQLYDRALTEDEIQKVMINPLASGPSPANGATDVPRDASFSWRSGGYADKHDVYFGTSFDDVDSADITTPLGVLVSPGQSANTFDPESIFEFDKTYYWRIDGVNDLESDSPWKGRIWSFETEPTGYLITNISVIASSSDQDPNAPLHTIDGSGFNDDDEHGSNSDDMWLSEEDPNGAWIQYDFDKVYQLHQLLVWNYNSEDEDILGYGAKDVLIQYSQDGVTWMDMESMVLDQAPGNNEVAGAQTIDLVNIVAKSIRLVIISNHSKINLKQYGLSEVQFFYIPLRAREPQPQSGATDVDVDVVLSWRAGREAAEHNVYIDTDEQAVIDGDVPVSIVTEAQDSSLSLDLGEIYYWKVNEVIMAETPTMLEGDIWNLSTREYIVVDDFESYNDLNPDDPESNRIFLTWIGGDFDPANGSQVGHDKYPFAEQTIVHGGKQSMPLSYDNTTADYSEATANVATLGIGQDWTQHGIKTLSLWLYGDPNNVAQQMYVKLNDVKVLYDGDTTNITRIGWQLWNINLADVVGVNLSNVTELTIGLERSVASGGKGVVYIDDIRLYAYGRELITPVEPGTASLVGHWKFDEGSGTTAADSSGNNNHGTINRAEWIAGQLGGALRFNGRAYVTIPPEAWSSIEKQVTIALWAYGNPEMQPQEGCCFSAMQDPNVASAKVAQGYIPYSNGTVYFDSGGTSTGHDRISKAAIPMEYAGSWQHWTFTKDADTGENNIYLNGRLWHSGSGMTRPMTGVTAFTIGSKANNTQAYIGQLDDFRLYDRALSQEEIAWLAGWTKPFDKPF